MRKSRRNGENMLAMPICKFERIFFCSVSPSPAQRFDRLYRKLASRIVSFISGEKPPLSAARAALMSSEATFLSASRQNGKIVCLRAATVYCALLIVLITARERHEEPDQRPEYSSDARLRLSLPAEPNRRLRSGFAGLATVTM